MLFKEIKPGNAVYILDRNAVEAEKGTVSNVTPPHVSTQPGVIGMFVDITVNTAKGNPTYIVNDNAVTAYADNNNVIITTDVNNVLAELRAIKGRSEAVIGNIDKYKADIAKCDNLLADLDPVFKKERDNEIRFTKLEDAVAELAKSNAAQTESSKQIVELLTKLTKA